MTQKLLVPLLALSLYAPHVQALDYWWLPRCAYAAFTSALNLVTPSLPAGDVFYTTDDKTFRASEAVFAGYDILEAELKAVLHDDGVLVYYVRTKFRNTRNRNVYVQARNLRASETYKMMMDHFASRGREILALELEYEHWSDNIFDINKAREENAELTLEQASLDHCWSGRKAKEGGFTQVTILATGLRRDPYNYLKVRYEKP